MEIVNLPAHFDGKHILLNEPYELEPNAKLVVSVIQMDDDSEDELAGLALANLERACGDDEPEYSLDLIKEANPAYEGRWCRHRRNAPSRRRCEESARHFSPGDASVSGRFGLRREQPVASRGQGL